ncbi:MAG TPA: NUDIX domain-containing protein [Solirubrobacterales bacterium]|nr:NUDIX domain-containing protein [Solirubrobacterales bacterium]
MSDLDLGGDRRRTDPIKGKKVNFRYLGNSVLPPAASVTSVAAVPFAEDGRIVCVELRDRGVDIPGGHVRERETVLEDAVRREVLEEASIRLAEPKLVEVIESDYYGSRKEDLTYMLTFAAYVSDFLPFERNEESTRRVLLTDDEFIDNYRASEPEVMRRVIEHAKSVLGLTGE